MPACDLFRSTAPYYARYRPGYPKQLFSLLADAFCLDSHSIVLDLGCGTGQLAIPLACHVCRVIAMDPEPEMLREGRRVADHQCVSNIDWLAGGSEQLASVSAKLRLTTIGRAFHWMDRDRVLNDLYGKTVFSGGVAIIAEDTVATEQEVPYRRVVAAVIRRWLGDRRRAGAGFYHEPVERHAASIDRSAFERHERQVLSFARSWTVEQVVGHCFSTSFCSPVVLGDRMKAFSDDLTRELLQLESSGRFEEMVELEVFLLWREAAGVTKKGTRNDMTESVTAVDV